MKRERKQFGIFDWGILTLVAALVALGAFLFWKKSETVPPEVTIECVFRLPASAEKPNIAVGDSVRNENGTVMFGKITNISERPYQTVFLQEGQAVYQAVEGMQEIELTVRMTARKGEDYRVGDIRVSAGAQGTYRLGNTLVSGVRNISVKEVEA